MSTLQRSVLIVALGFALLLLRSVVWRAVALGPFTPQLVLPMAIFLGVSPDVRLVRGAEPLSRLALDGCTGGCPCEAIHEAEGDGHRWLSAAAGPEAVLVGQGHDLDEAVRRRGVELQLKGWVAPRRALGRVKGRL